MTSGFCVTGWCTLAVCIYSLSQLFFIVKGVEPFLYLNRIWTSSFYIALLALFPLTKLCAM